LRQRQFLHLDLDLVWQVPARAPADRASRGRREPPVGMSTDRAENEWLLHRLRQSRIVRPGRLEYFDSSLFGVLVRIERFEQVVPAIEQPEPEPETPGQDANEVAGADTDSGG
ncbi:MAG: CsiV family protein, partial [Wenzhouxiangellaceae bacterium]